MEEIKLLVEAVAKLPNAALWVLLGYLVYKLAVIGSIYGLIRFAIDKAHSWLTKPTVVLYQWKEGIQPISQETKASIIFSLEKLKAHTALNKSYDYCSKDYAVALDTAVNAYISNTPAKK